MSDRYAGDVFWFTSNWDSTGMQNAVVLDGQTLPIDSTNSPLYSLLRYLGLIPTEDNATTFTLPDLTGDAPIKFTPYMVNPDTWPPSIDLGFFRVTNSPYTGEVDYWSGDYPPSGWAACDGSLLPTNQNQALFSILRNTYGGDGQKTFALPNIPGSVICLSGYFPSRG
jgi:microcystin-dependent protein